MYWHCLQDEMSLKMELKADVCALLLGDLNVCLLKKARITVGACRCAPFQLDRSHKAFRMERKWPNKPLCSCLWSLCRDSLSGCHSQHPGSETAAPVWPTAHTAGHPLPALNCAPSSQSWGCWIEGRRHSLSLSYFPLWVHWEVGLPQLPQHPPPSSYLSGNCRLPAELGPCCVLELYFLLFLASLGPDSPRWCRNENMSETLIIKGERRLCRFHPGDHWYLPNSSLVDGAFQQSLGFCWKRKEKSRGRLQK